MNRSQEPTLPSVIERDNKEEKRIFILILLIFCGLIVAIAILLWLIPYLGFSNIHRYLPHVMAALFALIVGFFVGGALTMIFTILKGKNLFFNTKIRGLVIRILFPAIVALGRLLGYSKDTIRQSFVAVNNHLVMAEAPKVKGRDILLLLPHCLQNHQCDVRITWDVYNCKGCGRCRIKDLVELSQEYGVQISIATGGTLARKIVVEKRPKVIVAVACERDLSSGIQDAYPIPVFGVLNIRPNGPCFNTDLDITLVRKGIITFMED